MTRPASTPVLSYVLFGIANFIVSPGSFFADFNESHVFNERWPPHARFHNGQTMTLSLLLSSMSMYLLFRASPSAESKKQDIWLAALVGSFYCFAGLSAILYPGTDWADPEFPPPVPALQAYLFSSQVAIIWLGYLAASSALSKAKSG